MLDTISVVAEPSCSPAALGHVLPRYGGVAALVDPGRPWGHEHDRSSRDRLLERIAAYLDTDHLPASEGDASAYGVLLVPGDTLDQSQSRYTTEGVEILGGVVPAMFIGTKAITHPLVDDEADRPAAWSSAMADMMGDAALTGFTAFSIRDAARAGRLLLADGPVRLKDVCGKAGLGQTVVHDATSLDEMLMQEDAAALAQCGIVLEANLTDVITYSVGSVQLGEDSISYWGSQTLTVDHQGREVYGGSDLCAVRGSFDALAALDLPASVVRAIECAATFDRSAHLAYPDIRLTRRNYDVIEGTDTA